jgi:hypothetical protein
VQAMTLGADPVTTTLGNGERNVAGMVLAFALLAFAQAAVLGWSHRASLRPLYGLLAALLSFGLALILFSALYFATADVMLSPSSDISQDTLTNIRYVFQALFGIARVLCYWVAFDSMGLVRPSSAADQGQNAFGFEWSPSAISKGKLAFVYAAIISLVTAGLSIAAQYLFQQDPMQGNISSGCPQCGGFNTPSSWYISLAKGLFDTCTYSVQDPVETLSTILNIPVCIALLVAGVVVLRHEFKQHGGGLPFPKTTVTHQIVLVVLFATIQLLPWAFAAGVGVDRTQQPFPVCTGISDDTGASKYVSWMASSAAMSTLPMVLLLSAASLNRMINSRGQFSINPEMPSREYQAQPDVTSKLMQYA